MSKYLPMASQIRSLPIGSEEILPMASK